MTGRRGDRRPGPVVALMTGLIVAVSAVIGLVITWAAQGVGR